MMEEARWGVFGERAPSAGQGGGAVAWAEFQGNAEPDGHEIIGINPAAYRGPADPGATMPGMKPKVLTSSHGSTSRPMCWWSAPTARSRTLEDLV